MATSVRTGRVVARIATSTVPAPGPSAEEAGHPGTGQLYALGVGTERESWPCKVAGSLQRIIGRGLQRSRPGLDERSERREPERLLLIAVVIGRTPAAADALEPLHELGRQ